MSVPALASGTSVIARGALAQEPLEFTREHVPGRHVLLLGRRCLGVGRLGPRLGLGEGANAASSSIGFRCVWTFNSMNSNPAALRGAAEDTSAQTPNFMVSLLLVFLK